VEVELKTMNPIVELVLKHKKANMRKSEFLMLEALKSAPRLNDPNATSMYNKITHFPGPKGILKLADHNWKLTQTRQFYRHSYSAPTPTINTLQQIGLTITKAFAIHIRYARRRFLEHSAITFTPDTTVPLYNYQLIGT